jgi:hypothetical protein
MPQFLFIGDAISMASIRDYLFSKKIDKGDTLVLNPSDYENIIEEIKNSDTPIDIPLNVFGVLIVKDATGEVPGGKVQVVENDKM